MSKSLKIAGAAFLGVAPLLSAGQAEPITLAEQLGYKATDRLLIVNGDDVGMCHAANTAAIESLERGLMTSATIMAPCPWFPEIAAYAREHPEKGFGLHLTHTSEWKRYRWGPVAPRSRVPGLVDGEGYLWPSIQEVYQYATPEEAELEARAQIEKALAAGIDLTHLDTHMGALQYDARFYEVYKKLAVDYRLPVRMGSQEVLERVGFGRMREELAAAGVVFPDHLVHGGPNEGESVTAYWKRILADLKAGVTEIYIHAADDTGELSAITSRHKDRVEEHRLFTSDPEIRRILSSRNVIRIGYRTLRDLQRR